MKGKKKEHGFVYIVKCSDLTLYTGHTNNVEKRIQKHNESKEGAKYTRSRRPVVLAYQEKLTNMTEARKREAAIKKLSRDQKLALIKNTLQKT